MSQTRFARIAACCSSFLLAALFCWGTALGANGAAPAGSVIPCKDPWSCIPNAKCYGYFRTQWREWPGELRPDKTFPASVGKELLPTPPPQEGSPFHEELPAPKGQPLPPDQAKPESVLPDISQPEGIFPPPGALKNEEPTPRKPKPRGLEEPAEPQRTTPRVPGIEGTLPGMPADRGGMLPDRGGATPEQGGVTPMEPGPERRSPAVPNEPRESERSPSGAGEKPAAGEGALGRPRWRAPDQRPVEPVQQPFPADRTPTDRIEADWTRALEPGLYGEVDRTRTQNFSARPVRQAAHQAPAGSDATPNVQRPVFVQPAEQQASVARASWQQERQENVRIALDGYCPVELGKNERWVKGDRACAHVHQGLTYYFSSPIQRECFLVEPDRYAPAYSGYDPVSLLDENRNMPGQVAFCASYDGRVYMFSSAANQARFRQDPKRYVQAVRQ